MPKSSAKKRTSLRKPLGPYFRFSQAIRPQLKKENPDLSFGAISKLVGSKWHALDSKEKAKYSEEYKKEFTEYEKATQKQREVTDDNFNSVNNNSSTALGGEETPSSNLERFLRWMPPAPGAYRDELSQQQYMPYYSDSIQQQYMPYMHNPGVHPVMINGAMAPQQGNNDCAIVSYTAPEPPNQNGAAGPGPVPTGIFVSEYYQELVGAKFSEQK